MTTRKNDPSMPDTSTSTAVLPIVSPTNPNLPPIVAMTTGTNNAVSRSTNSSSNSNTCMTNTNPNNRIVQPSSPPIPKLMIPMTEAPIIAQLMGGSNTSSTSPYPLNHKDMNQNRNHHHHPKNHSCSDSDYTICQVRVQTFPMRMMMMNHNNDIPQESSNDVDDDDDDDDDSFVKSQESRKENKANHDHHHNNNDMVDPIHPRSNKRSLDTDRPTNHNHHHPTNVPNSTADHSSNMYAKKFKTATKTTIPTGNHSSKVTTTTVVPLRTSSRRKQIRTFHHSSNSRIHPTNHPNDGDDDDDDDDDDDTRATTSRMTNQHHHGTKSNTSSSSSKVVPANTTTTARKSMRSTTMGQKNYSMNHHNENNDSNSHSDQVWYADKIRTWCHEILGIDVRLGIRFMDKELRVHFPLIMAASTSSSSSSPVSPTSTMMVTEERHGATTFPGRRTTSRFQRLRQHPLDLLLPVVPPYRSTSSSIHSPILPLKMQPSAGNTVSQHNPPSNTNSARNHTNTTSNNMQRYTNQSCIAIMSLHYNGIGKLFGFQFNDVFVQPGKNFTKDMYPNNTNTMKVINNGLSPTWSFMTISQLYQALHHLYQYGSYTFYVVRKQQRIIRTPVPPSTSTTSATVSFGPQPSSSKRNEPRPKHSIPQQQEGPENKQQPPSIVDHQTIGSNTAPTMQSSTNAVSTANTQKASTKYTIGTSALNIPDGITTIPDNLVPPLSEVVSTNDSKNTASTTSDAKLMLVQRIHKSPPNSTNHPIHGEKANNTTYRPLPNADGYHKNENYSVADVISTAYATNAASTEPAPLARKADGILSPSETMSYAIPVKPLGSTEGKASSHPMANEKKIQSLKQKRLKMDALVAQCQRVNEKSNVIKNQNYSSLPFWNERRDCDIKHLEQKAEGLMCGWIDKLKGDLLNAGIPVPTAPMEVEADTLPLKKSISDGGSSNSKEIAMAAIQRLLIIPERNHDRKNVNIAPRPNLLVPPKLLVPTKIHKNVEIAPRPESLVRTTARNNVDVAKRPSEPVASNDLVTHMFPMTTCESQSNAVHQATDTIQNKSQDNMVASRCPSITGNINHSGRNHGDDEASVVQDHALCTSHISQTSVTSTAAALYNRMAENEKEKYFEKLPNAIYKEDINLLYDVVLGRPAINLLRPLKGRLMSLHSAGAQTLSENTDTASNSFDTDPSTASYNGTTGSTSINAETLTQSFSFGQILPVFDTTLNEWWEKYELASHNDKVHVAKLCIVDMVRKGCRFLQRMDDGTRYGYYTEVPPHDESIRRKVLRALRQVVIQRLTAFTEEERNRHKQKVLVQRAFIKSQEYKQRQAAFTVEELDLHRQKVLAQRVSIKDQECKQRVSSQVGHSSSEPANPKAMPVATTETNSTRATTNDASIAVSPPIDAILSPVILNDMRTQSTQKDAPTTD